MGKRAAITELVLTRPYTARERLREAFVRHRGSTTEVGREFGVSRWRISAFVRRLGLGEHVAAVRAQLSRDLRARRARAWSAYGNALKAAKRGAFPPVGKK